MKSRFEYEIPLVFYDTPGTSSHSSKLEHAILLKHLLEYRPLNTVFILVKFN